MLIEQETESSKKDKKDTKVTLDTKDFKFYITVELCLHLPEGGPGSNTPRSLSRLRIHIIEPLKSSLLNPIQKLYNAVFLFILDGKQLDIEQPPHALGLKDGAQVFVFGALSTKIENIGVVSSLKFFKRFRDSRNDGWYIGRDRWDAVTFAPRRNVRIFGAGIYEPYP